MQIKEAYSILEIPEGSPPDEVKKKYRQLTKKYHPDINKESDAEDKFKKINEAYQVASTGKSTDKNPPSSGRTGGNPFAHGTQFIRLENIDLYATISFKDAILGCKIDLKFNRKSKCNDCQGIGYLTINNGCDKCNGSGQTTVRQNNMVFIQNCDKCHGKLNHKSCEDCIGSGIVESLTSINVSIPPGIKNENILRLNGMGNFAGRFGPIEQHTDAHLHIKVIPEEGLTFDGTYVITTLSISLLDALRGCKKSVKTILGNKDIDVGAMSKNKEEILLYNVGVAGTGSQKVILDVSYPENTNKLIDVLIAEGNI